MCLFLVPSEAYPYTSRRNDTPKGNKVWLPDHSGLDKDLRQRYFELTTYDNPRLK